MSAVIRDPGLLVPAFLDRVEVVLSELRQNGHDPVIHETLRSKERSERLVREGKSAVKGGASMHCYGIAIDCICREHRWSCHEHKCDFFDRYGVAAEKHGLTWGGRWTTLRDLPHVQAVPVRLQGLVRATAPDHMETLVKTYFAGLLVATK